jgi:hypothetical protein
MNNTQNKYKFVLTKCPNPQHEFHIGKLVIDWQIAQDYWAKENEYNGITREIFCVKRVLTGNNLRVLNIILCKLSIWLAILPSKRKQL